MTTVVTEIHSSISHIFKEDNIATQIAKDVAFLNAMEKCYTNGETFVSFVLEELIFDWTVENSEDGDDDDMSELMTIKNYFEIEITSELVITFTENYQTCQWA